MFKMQSLAKLSCIGRIKHFCMRCYLKIMIFALVTVRRSASIGQLIAVYFPIMERAHCFIPLRQALVRFLDVVRMLLAFLRLRMQH